MSLFVKIYFALRKWTNVVYPMMYVHFQKSNPPFNLIISLFRLIKNTVIYRSGMKKSRRKSNTKNVPTISTYLYNPISPVSL